MSTAAIEMDFREKICAEVHLFAEGAERYQVFTPFQFDDGDHLSIILKRDQHGSQWVLSDEGNTIMRLTYDIDEAALGRGTRRQIIADALTMFGAEDRSGEIILGVEDSQFGNALFAFVQVILKISDVSLLSRDRVRTAFMDDFRHLTVEAVPEARRTFNWHDRERDPMGKYRVDCRINGMRRPVMLHALHNNYRTQTATIAIHQFIQWGLEFQPVAVFENQEQISSAVLARFNDVCETQFSNLMQERNRFISFLRESVDWVAS